MNNLIKRILRFSLPCLFFFPLATLATSWQIVPAESKLTFTATQNGAPVSGTFKKFTGEINFDPQQLATSNVKIMVDMASVSDAYNQLADTLKSADWFNSKVFPQATFSASNFVKTGDKSYQAKGTLTIRDKSVPVTLAFDLPEYSLTKAVAKGSMTIKRTAFGVGQGDWAATDAVKDNVQIDFSVAAIAKK